MQRNALSPIIDTASVLQPIEIAALSDVIGGYDWGKIGQAATVGGGVGTTVGTGVAAAFPPAAPFIPAFTALGAGAGAGVELYAQHQAARPAPAAPAR